jgi:diguanylate cyclase (GGDEF)-like protein/hemerythrin-like metal-binding protein
LCGIATDITERKRREDQVRQLAFQDALTKLPNRRLFNDRLRQNLAASKRSGFFGAVIFLDLDNFKSLNDTHGHFVGDLLLMEAAARLKSCVRETDTVSRFGGDEFVVMLSELNADKAESTSQARIVAEKIRATLSEPYRLAIKREGEADTTVEHRCTASIGVALFINHESSQRDILKQADAAMYRAKESGHNLIRFAAEKPQGVEDTTSASLVQLTWQPNYCCGHALIDSQHRALFGDVNKLFGAELAGRPTAEVDILIDVLIRDVVQHFKDEEAIITAAGFPGVAEHAALHREIVDRAGTVVDRFQAGTIEIGELFQFLANDIVAAHMLRADREFFP